MTSVRALLACLALATTEANAEPVDVELVLAVDVSESMDRDEFAVQRAGYVRSCVILPPSGQRFSGPSGRIAVRYFEQAGSIRQASIVPWQIIDDTQSALQRRYASEPAKRVNRVFSRHWSNLPIREQQSCARTRRPTPSY